MASPITTTSITPALLEVVDKRINEYVDKSQKTYSRFSKGVGKPINARGAFIIGESNANQSFNAGAEGMAYAQPGGQTLQRMVVNYKRYTMQTQITNDALQSKDGTISETLGRNLASDTSQFLKQNNREIFKSGNLIRGIVGTVGTGSNGFAVNQVQFAAPFGATEIGGVGGQFQFYTPNGVLRGAGTEIYTVTALSGQAATFNTTIATSGAGGAVAAGDFLCYTGSFGFGISGLPVHISDSVTGTYQGIARSALPFGFRAVTEDQQGAGLSTAAIERNKNRILYKRGADRAQPRRSYLCSPSQWNAYLQLGSTMGANNSSLLRFADNAKLDLQFKTAEYAGEMWDIDTDCPDTDLYSLDYAATDRYDYKPMGIEPLSGLENGMAPIPGFDSNGNGTWFDKKSYVMVHKWQLGSSDPAQQFRMFNLATTNVANRMGFSL